MPDLVSAVILGIVEGVTEFIPVSSTGHLIVAGHLLGFTGDRADTFEIFIQLGAILAVAVLYRKRIRSLLTFGGGAGVQGRGGVVLLAITSLPALALGAGFHGAITDHLFSPAVVAVGWGVGGLALLLVERFVPRPTTSGLAGVTVRQAAGVGLIQMISLWPGASRSAATIGGGMMLGMDRTTAAEYSFLAALPVLGAASVFSLVSSRDTLTSSDVPMFAAGFVVAFLTAWFAVRFFLRLLSFTTLRPFAWYRIGAALLLLGAVALDWI